METVCVRDPDAVAVLGVVEFVGASQTSEFHVSGESAGVLFPGHAHDRVFIGRIRTLTNLEISHAQFGVADISERATAVDFGAAYRQVDMDACRGLIFPPQMSRETSNLLVAGNLGGHIVDRHAGIVVCPLYL